MAASRGRNSRTRRINLRASVPQERLIRTGAESAGVTVTEFILNSACLQAEHILADKRQFVASPNQWQAFMEALDRPGKFMPQLAKFFGETPPARRQSGK
jgi:uncharacterized protein (DUF1778 family)